jgi:hypothetical protein
MEIKFKLGKETLIARNEVQAAAFINKGFEPATKADAEKLSKLQGVEVQEDSTEE